jgi:RNA recognition motif-containing protein
VLTEVDPQVRVRIGKDKMTGKSRGFAFAEFSDATRAADAIRRFDSFEMNGRRLRVNDADDKPPARAPRPGGPVGIAAPAFAPSGGDRSFIGGGFSPPDMGGGGDSFRNKKGGSRRNLRARKRSLRYS